MTGGATSQAASGSVTVNYSPGTQVSARIRVSDGEPSTVDVDKGYTITVPAAPAPTTWRQYTYGPVNTWSNYTNAGGTFGGQIPGSSSVLVSCRLTGWTAPNGNNNWYRIASGPTAGFYASADAFYNNGATSGPLTGTPYVDTSVAQC